MQLLDSSLVQLDVTVDSWQSAIRCAAEPLVKNKFVTKEYPERVIEIAEKDGPYIVIAPHIALSHAAVSDGALKNGLGLTVLTEPVKFGNKVNDPVSIVFTLSSVGDDIHLSQMAALVNVLQKTRVIEKVTRSNDVNEVIDLFNER